MKHQKDVNARYEKQLERVQEQMTEDINGKDEYIEKMKVENDKFKVYLNN